MTIFNDKGEFACGAPIDDRRMTTSARIDKAAKLTGPHRRRAFAEIRNDIDEGVFFEKPERKRKGNLA